MDKQRAASDILSKALPNVPFDGWNQRTLKKAALAAGYKESDVIRVFPGGAIDASDTFLRQATAQMMEQLQHYHLDNMKIRERVATAVRLIFEALAPHREAVRKSLALQSMPFNLGHGLRNLYDTVDAIWYAIGDTSTDFNFYTKRMMLAGVYSATMLCWLDDKTPGYEATWSFLDRRIEDVMRIEKAKARARTFFKIA